MTAIEFVRGLIEQSSKTQKEVGLEMGWSEQNISNKFRRKSLSADEFMRIIEILGYEMKIVERDTNAEVYNRKKGIGSRLKMMVNGVKYDTYKADAICHSNEDEDFFDELYQDDAGRYFVAHYVKWEGGVNSISPILEEDAKRLIEKFSD